MPIYEYQCDGCETIFEELVLRKDDGPDACPSCGGDSVQRVISNTNFQLKGGGWYVTDFKGGSSSPAAAPAAGGAEASSTDAPDTSAKPGDAAAPKASDTPSSASGDSAPKSPSGGEKGAA